MAATLQQHHIKALTPTWFLASRKPAPAGAAHSPLLLSPATWQKAQDRREEKGDAGGGLPASPQISCMGQVKGRRGGRGCSTARGPVPARGSGHHGSGGGGGGGKVATLVLGLFGRRTARTSSRACARVRDVPRGSATAPGGRGALAAVAGVVGVFDPPLPVVRRPPPTGDDSTPSLWERRRGGRALEGLQLS